MSARFSIFYFVLTSSAFLTLSLSTSLLRLLEHRWWGRQLAEFIPLRFWRTPAGSGGVANSGGGGPVGSGGIASSGGAPSAGGATAVARREAGAKASGGQTGSGGGGPTGAIDYTYNPDSGVRG